MRARNRHFSWCWQTSGTRIYPSSLWYFDTVRERFWRLLFVALLNLLAPEVSTAGVLRYCSAAPQLTAVQQDKILQFAAIAREALATSGSRLAIVSRSGLDLSYFNQRYSHAGVSLQTISGMPWSVRQLYFDCAEQKPRLFDQGLAGFVLGADDPDKGFLSMVFLPTAEANALEEAAQNNAVSLQLLARQYSANAYAFSTLYQNCNQWVAELLAVAWAPQRPSGSDARMHAQSWLATQGYAPTEFTLNWRPMLWATAWSNLVHTDDHPAADLEALTLRVSMPASLEAFIQAKFPAADRVELCRTRTQVVIRRGWRPLPDDCIAADGDQQIAFAP